MPSLTRRVLDLLGQVGVCCFAIVAGWTIVLLLWLGVFALVEQLNAPRLLFLIVLLIGVPLAFCVGTAYFIWTVARLRITSPWAGYALGILYGIGIVFVLWFCLFETLYRRPYRKDGLIGANSGRDCDYAIRVTKNTEATINKMIPPAKLRAYPRRHAALASLFPQAYPQTSPRKMIESKVNPKT
ncbi:hypothetical protein [Rubinisphaera margarita]|uniref:hypothetical protein n=1 Tax=Rubinisphaera margarita TaxID=2909586 RepID=UPI001EE7AC9F|nr:hypothetical protein [Rubinisphaera margarita]MCG6154784.1 hypothetical protein [Rubinisphaera margarita]